MIPEALAEALTLLENETPLSDDCGRLCGAACCETRPGEETGMLLFPGEAARYRGKDGWRVLPSAQREIVICPGTCARGDRPLSCRLFPLLPLVRDGAIRVAADARAAAVCPLYRSGARGLQPAFVDAVRACGETLLRDPEQAAFLRRLTAAHDELRDLQRRFGRV